MLAVGEHERHDRNETAVGMLKGMVRTLRFDTSPQHAAMVAAYPPEELEENTDADTLRFEYMERDGMDGPYDWWSEARFLSCRFMRQAHERGLSGLLKDPSTRASGPRFRGSSQSGTWIGGGRRCDTQGRRLQRVRRPSALILEMRPGRGILRGVPASLCAASSKE